MLEVRPDNMADEYGYGPDMVIDMKALMGTAPIIFRVCRRREKRLLNCLMNTVL